MSDTIIAISSHVARGGVGNRAMVFALERLGFEVWAVPTVILPHHPGHRRVQRIAPGDREFAVLLEELLAHGRAAHVAGIISGYLACPEQAEAVAALVGTVKQAQPDALYLCDPVIGDAVGGGPGGLYVQQELATAVRDLLLPLADAATPNAFECAWLAGSLEREPDLAQLARKLAPATVLVTSAPALARGHVGNLLVEARATTLLEHPALATPVKGTGDLLAALLIGRRLQGCDWRKAAELAISSVFQIVAGTAKAEADEMMLARLQAAIVQPRAAVNVRNLLQPASEPRGGREPKL